MERVADVARLARLRLSPEEYESMNLELEQVLAYMGVLQSAEGGDEPTPVSMHTMREDLVCPSQPRQELLSNAPTQDGECILVPRVVDA